MTDARGGAANDAADVGQVFTDELGEVGAREMAPQIFHRVQLGRVRRQDFHRQPRGLATLAWLRSKRWRRNNKRTCPH
jgi:predicted acylesterase/phospholipase RssA